MANPKINDLEVLLVAFHYPPEVSGGAPRAFITEDFLVREGCRVRVLTRQTIKQGCRGGDVISVPIYGDRASAAVMTATAFKTALSTLARWFFVPDIYAPWAVMAIRHVLRHTRGRRIDLVITSSSPESAHAIGWWLKKYYGCLWLADLRDGWTFEPHRREAAFPLRRLVERRIERAVVENADWLTAGSRPISDDLCARYPNKRDRIYFLPTGFETTKVKRQGQESKLFRLVYTGRFGLSRKTITPHVLIKGIKLALERDQDFAKLFRLVLAGSFKKSERTIWSKPPISLCVEELGQQSHDEALSIAAGATMLLLVTPPGLRSIAPRKLFDYLHVRRPIFALAEHNESARIIEETRSGVCVSQSDPEVVSKRLLHMFSLWRRGKLDEEVPCSGNDLYRAETHLRRVLGDVILASVYNKKQ